MGRDCVEVRVRLAVACALLIGFAGRQRASIHPAAFDQKFVANLRNAAFIVVHERNQQLDRSLADVFGILIDTGVGIAVGHTERGQAWVLGHLISGVFEHATRRRIVRQALVHEGIIANEQNRRWSTVEGLIPVMYSIQSATDAQQRYQEQQNHANDRPTSKETGKVESRPLGELPVAAREQFQVIKSLRLCLAKRDFLLILFRRGCDRGFQFNVEWVRKIGTFGFEKQTQSDKQNKGE